MSGATNQIKQLATNLELLRLTHNVLCQLLQEQVQKKTAVSFVEAKTIQSVLVLVQERWRQETRKLPGGALDVVASSDFHHVPFSIPEDRLAELPEAVRQSTWFKVCFPHISDSPR